MMTTADQQMHLWFEKQSTRFADEYRENYLHDSRSTISRRNSAREQTQITNSERMGRRMHEDNERYSHDGYSHEGYSRETHSDKSYSQETRTRTVSQALNTYGTNSRRNSMSDRVLREHDERMARRRHEAELDNHSRAAGTSSLSKTSKPYSRLPPASDPRLVPYTESESPAYAPRRSQTSRNRSDERERKHTLSRSLESGDHLFRYRSGGLDPAQFRPGDRVGIRNRTSVENTRDTTLIRDKTDVSLRFGAGRLQVGGSHHSSSISRDVESSYSGTVRRPVDRYSSTSRDTVDYYNGTREIGHCHSIWCTNNPQTCSVHYPPYGLGGRGRRGRRR